MRLHFSDGGLLDPSVLVVAVARRAAARTEQGKGSGLLNRCGTRVGVVSGHGQVIGHTASS